jgi:hypothetical protein
MKLERSKKWDLSKPESLKDLSPSLLQLITTQSHLDDFKIDAKESIQSRLDFLRIREEKSKGEITGIDIEHKLEKIAELALRRRYKQPFYHGYATLIEHNFSSEQRKLIYFLLSKIDEALPWEGIRYVYHYKLGKK